MKITAMREELIFITSIIKSGCAFGKCQSDGSGVFIPPAVFKKYSQGSDIGDCMVARMINNANDVRGELPFLAVSMSLPIGVFDDDISKSDEDIDASDVANFLLDDGYDDRWFSVEDMLVELSLPLMAKNIKAVRAKLDELCDQGVCQHVACRLGSSVRDWYTAEPFRPE
jgi:hypothetical protein